MADGGATDGAPRDHGPQDAAAVDGGVGDAPTGDRRTPDAGADAEPCLPFTIDGRRWELLEIDLIGGAPIYPDLALDPDETPVAVFTKGTRNQRFPAVSRFAGAGWTAAEIIEQQPNRYLGKRPSLAIDGDFGLHVTAYDEDGENLRYAFRAAAASSWQVEVIYPPGPGVDAGDHSSLAFDAAGRLHLSFHEYTGGRLLYGWREAGRWSFEEVAEPGVSSSLVLDAAGTPQLAYFTGQHLHHALRGPAGWVTELADGSSDDIGHYPSLAVGSDGTPCAAYLRWPADQSAVKVARRLGGSWQSEVVDDGLGITYTTGIAILGCGTLAVAYARNQGVGVPGLWFAYRNPSESAWSRHSVDANALASGIDMVADRAGVVHIVYLDEGPKLLRHARLVSQP